MADFTTGYSLPYPVESDTIANKAVPDNLRTDIQALAVQTDGALATVREGAATDATAKANTAEANAVATAHTKDQTVLVNAKDYAEAEDIVNLNAAKSYADTKDTANRSAWAQADTVTLNAAKTYADDKDTTNRSAWAAADTTTLNSAKAYADTKKTEAIADATTKYGGLPARVGAVEDVSPKPNDDDSWRVMDKTGSVALEVTSQGGVKTADTLTKPLHPGTGYVLAFTDLLGRIAFGVREDGTTTAVAPDTGNPALSNTSLRDAQRTSRGGSIGTAGKPAVALRVDHNNKPFQEKMLPLLRARGLPASMCHFVDEMDPQPGYTGDDSVGYTWADVERTAISDGIEVWNHSWSHTDTSGTFGLTHEIVESKAELERVMPRVSVQGLMVPGVGGGSWDGFTNNLGNPDAFHETEAGRLVMGSHPACTGGGSTLWPLDGTVRNGIGSTQIDTHTTSAAAIGVMQHAKDTLAGTVLMIHPSNIDAGAGRITTTVLTEILDWIVAERDAGNIEVLTLSGLLLADANRSTRHNLVRDPSFSRGGSTWSGMAGYTVANGVASGTASVGLLAASVSLGAVGWAKGSPRMVTAEFRAPEGATVRVRAVDSTTAANFEVVRDVVLPASPNWVQVRQPVCIPRTGTETIRYEAGRLSGGPVDVRYPGINAV